MTSSHARGREDLAMNLLGVSGSAEMTAQEILAALEKAPLPDAAPPPPAPATFSNAWPADHARAMMGLTPKQLGDERLYTAGMQLAKYLFGKMGARLIARQ